MRRLQTHRSHDASLKRFFPWRGAHAPAVSSLQTGKAELRTRRNQVVSYGSLMAQEFIIHHDADSVISKVIGTTVAFSIAVESRQWVCATSLEGAAEDILYHNHQRS